MSESSSGVVDVSFEAGAVAACNEDASGMLTWVDGRSVGSVRRETLG